MRLIRVAPALFLGWLLLPMAASADPPVIDLTAVDYAIEMPEAIPSGWTTLRFANEGDEPHHVLFARLPDGKTIEQYQAEVGMSFQDVWYALRDEGIDQEEAFGRLIASVPEWTWQIEFMGGPGVTAPGKGSTVTVYLTPGTYAVECYMKTDEGEMHWAEGMIRPLTVTEERSTAQPPAPDVTVTLSNFDLTVEGDLRPGTRTVAVRNTENPEAGFGHSVYVTRVNSDATTEDILHWMNFMNIDGLTPDTPGTFIGGDPMNAATNRLAGWL
jgi:hypothetical protein